MNQDIVTNLGETEVEIINRFYDIVIAGYVLFFGLVAIAALYFYITDKFKFKSNGTKHIS